MTFYDGAPLKRAGLALLLVLALVSTLVYLQFRGRLQDTTALTVHSGRAGLVLDPGARATYNGVVVGRVSEITAVAGADGMSARLTVDVESRHIAVMPANLVADISASTIFGNKVMSFSAPADPSPERVSSDTVITTGSVTTEFQTLFETMTGLAERIDPVELNLTLAATAEALTGLGGRVGRALVQANEVLAEANPRLPRLQRGLVALADTAEVFTGAGPDLWDALQNATTTAATLNAGRSELDAALLAAAGFAGTAADTLDRSSPYLIRGLADLVVSSRLLDTYSPSFFCGIRGAAEVRPAALAAFGGNGYALSARSSLIGAPNPYVYPDNLPRINARGGPGGAPGCWQRTTRDFWPAPHLVVDTGATLAPYNHFELGQPLLTEYVWGRQAGANTINP